MSAEAARRRPGSEPVTEATIQPFAEAAPLYAALGLRPVPVGLDKKPAVKNWQRFGPNSYKRFLDRFAGYNVGAVNGRDPLPITVVDIDDPEERDWCLERFGDTPVKVRTASGGEHWYYRANGERRKVRFEGHAVDILAAGGYGVLPPSHTPQGLYSFIEGCPEAFADLPPLSATQTPHEAVQAREGDGRNKALFDAMRTVAMSVSSHGELLEQAHAHNRQFAVLLGDAEVAKVVGSVWKYRTEDRLMVSGCESQLVVPASLVDQCLTCPDAIALLAKVKQLHGHRGGAPFRLPAATGPRIMGWSHDRYTRARDHLISIGELHMVTAGEKGKRVPTVVRLPSTRIPVTK